jgi:hypothetical protein
MALSSFLSSFSAASRANRNLRLGLYLSNSSAIFSGGQASAEAIKLPSASRFPIIFKSHLLPPNHPYQCFNRLQAQNQIWFSDLNVSD